MIRRIQARVILVLATATAAFLGSGCAYLHDRGNDAKHMFDIGVTLNTSAKPNFALYADFFNLTPLGYSKVDGILLGVGNGQIGALEHVSENWGVLAVGSERIGSGDFNPLDPRQARPDQADLDDWPRFDVGFVGAFKGDEPPPKMQFLQCERQIHLGWIGIHLAIRPLDIVNFIVGWTTLDLIGD